MKNKQVLGIAFVAVAVALVSGQPGFCQASGSIDASGANQGQENNTDNLNTGKEAFQVHVADQQNYMSGPGQHTSKTQQPITGGGLNPAYTAPMAPGSVDMSPFPSGMFHYGFPNSPTTPYFGPYKSAGGIGGMLPNTSTGSVDFNTVDMTGIAGVGMNSPGRGQGPVNLTSPQQQGPPSSSSSSTSIFDWLNNSFFGP